MFNQKLYPYMSLYIDAELSDYMQAIRYCASGTLPIDSLLADLTSLWMSSTNSNPCLPCLSVRTGLDLYLTAKQFPAGSEIIMSAINIPSIGCIFHAHGLKIVSLDVDIDTMAPRLELLDSLVTPKTRILLLANIYGRGFCLDEYIDAAARHGIEVIEDWAEGFSGLHYLGNPRSDLVLFSFGPIKYYTAFGGCIAKVRDPDLYDSMKQIYNSYPRQTRRGYLYKILKYLPVYYCLNVPWFNCMIIRICNTLQIDYKKAAVNMLRGFPADKLIVSLRQQPSDSLLAVMLYRLKDCDGSHIVEANEKVEYVIQRLPESMRTVGLSASIRNHWLFPVLVDNPTEAMLSLSAVGVDAYRGATQLNIIESDPDSLTSSTQPQSSVSLTQLNPNVITVSSNKTRSQSDTLSTLQAKPLVCCTNVSQDTHSHSEENLLEQSLFYSTSENGFSHEKYLSREARPLETGNLHYTLLLKNAEFNKDERYPHNARYLIDHVIYLPINRHVPFNVLKQMCRAINHAMTQGSNKNDSRLDSNQSSKLLMRSKL